MQLIKQQLKLAKKPGLKKSKKQTTKAAAPPHVRDRSERVCTYTFSQGLLGEWERAWLHCQRLRPVSGAVLRVRGAGTEEASTAPAGQWQRWWPTVWGRRLLWQCALDEVAYGHLVIISLGSLSLSRIAARTAPGHGPSTSCHVPQW